MTIFYEIEERGLLVSDTGIVFRGKKFPLSRIDSWTVDCTGKIGELEILCVVVILKSVIPSFFYRPTVHLLFLDRFIENHDLNGHCKFKARIQGKTIEEIREDDASWFEAECNEFKLLARALDTMMASQHG